MHGAAPTCANSNETNAELHGDTGQHDGQLNGPVESTWNPAPTQTKHAVATGRADVDTPSAGIVQCTRLRAHLTYVYVVVVVAGGSVRAWPRRVVIILFADPCQLDMEPTLQKN